MISLSDTPWYHCVNRCVRRAYLCGEDAVTGVSYEHRRGWIADKIKALAAVFAIDVAAYAVMSNHYHVVVRVDRDRAAAWSDDEVMLRWTTLFKGPLLVQRYQTQRETMSEAEHDKVAELSAAYRARLYDVSWFMRVLNESIARQANAEDGVKGRFWEGRFRSQALLDDTAVLAAMAYVDLNPVRAGMAETPEESDYTAIQERIRQLVTPKRGRPKKVKAIEPAEAVPTSAPLMPFDATARTAWAVPFALQDYLELVDWTGRQLRDDKRGAIPASAARLLDRLNIEPARFVILAQGEFRRFGNAIGAPASLIEHRARRQVKFLKGMQTARRLLSTAQAA